MISDDRARWTIRDVALARLAASPDQPFAEDQEGRSETYAAFIGTAATLAHAMRGLGVGRGTPVAILCPSGLPHLHAWLACGLLGATEVPINPVLRGEALRHVLATTQPALAFVEASLLPGFLHAHETVGSVASLIVLADGPAGPVTTPADMRAVSYHDIVGGGPSPVPDGDVAVSDIGSVMFTSGTTGPSKGVAMPNGQLCLLALQVIQAMRLGPDDVFYCVHPLNHIAGKYMGVFTTFATGGRLVLDARFEAANWTRRIGETGATISIAHGPMIEMIFAQPPAPGDRAHALRRLMSSPMPKHLWSDFEARFDLRAIEMWGMTETACPVWMSLDGPHVKNSCGRVLTQWGELRIVDPDTDEELPFGQVGEIVVRPRYPFTFMQGYLGQPDETLKAWRNLWFHTGDAATLDADGNLFFIDRLKDRIRRRSENISAYDIEVAALAHPAVREAAAIGVPSGFEGDDDIKLWLVLEDGSALDPPELIAFMARRLAPFMVPRYVETTEALPRTPTNKVKKRELVGAGNTARTWDRQEAGVRLRDFYE